MNVFMIIYSPAKLNLYLEILGKRQDGYHNIRTIFERISLFDKITLDVNSSGVIIIKSASGDIPKDSNNIAYKAAKLLKDDFGIKDGVDIEIEKNIPVGAGLGGGSSNAASVLVGLNKIWKLGLNKKKLVEYAAKLGSDVAFFIYEYAFALGESRGEKITPLNWKRKFWHILLVPKFSVSTRLIYQELDKSDDWSKRAFKKTDRIEKILFNRLEDITFKKYPEVKKAKDILREQGLDNVLMSGSGSSVFGIIKSRKEGLKLARFFRRLKGYRVFVAATV